MLYFCLFFTYTTELSLFMNDFTSFFEKVKLMYSPRDESGSNESISSSNFVITMIIHGNELNRIILNLGLYT